jgi:hypothetical protein
MTPVMKVLIVLATISALIISASVAVILYSFAKMGGYL